VIFRVWDSATASGAANLVYSEKQVVTVFQGQFSVLVGAGADVAGEDAKGPTNVDLAEVFDGSERYLGVTVAAAVAPATVQPSDVEITPRQQIVATAFAFRAKEAETVVSSSIGTAAIADGAITLGKMAGNSVNGSQIVDGSVSANDLANGSVTSSKLGGNSVGSAAILNGSILNEDLSGSSVTGAKILNGTILSVDLADGAVTSAKLGSDVGRWSVSGGDVFRSSGRVGIGTSSPQSTLHVEGTLELDDTIRADDSSGLYFQTDEGANRMRIADNGRIGIGTTNPAQSLHISTAGLSPNLRLQNTGQFSNYFWDFSAQTGHLVLDSGGSGLGQFNFSSGAYTTGSDRSLKKNVKPLPATLDRLLKLEPVSYLFKSQPEDGEVSLGFIAQDVQPLFSEVVRQLPNEKLGLTYTELIPITVASIQELKAEKDAEIAARDQTIEDLRERLEVLEAQEEAREARLVALEKLLQPDDNPPGLTASFQMESR
jgi:hypothetical protein